MGDMNGKKLTASLIWTLEHLEFLEHLEYLELLELTTTSLSLDNPKRTLIRYSKALGQLVTLGFDIAAFTPASYRRPRLGRPSMEI